MKFASGIPKTKENFSSLAVNYKNRTRSNDISNQYNKRKASYTDMVKSKRELETTLVKKRKENL